MCTLAGYKRNMSHSNRIAEIRRAKDISQTELAERIGTTLSHIGKLERGDRRLNLDWLRKIAKALDVDLAELVSTGGRESETRSLPFPVRGERRSAAVSDDEVEIQQWDIAYGMGGGGYVDLPVTGEKHKFSRSWLRQFTHAPSDKVFLASGTGDSMTPTIMDADIVVIDTSQKEVRQGDRIWAAAYGQTGIIKRLRPMPDGGVKIISDNAAVPPETAYDGELHIVGRIVAIIRKT